jgi:hypothetical protein
LPSHPKIAFGIAALDGRVSTALRGLCHPDTQQLDRP